VAYQQCHKTKVTNLFKWKIENGKLKMKVEKKNTSENKLKFPTG
jgi:hypothetical protein